MPKITLLPLNRVIEVAAGTTILIGATREGIDITHDCTEGICGTDIARITEGAENLSDKTEAEDLFQDVLVKVFARLDELVEIDHPGSWLSRVLYNHFVDNQRRYARQRMVVVDEGQLPGKDLGSLPGGTNPEQLADLPFPIQVITRAVVDLTERCDERVLGLEHHARLNLW